MLAMLPKEFPVPLAIALHIPPGYTEELAKRLDRICAIEVQEAKEGLELRPGLAVLARGGQHLKLSNARDGLFARIDREPIQEPHAPSVDVLFESAAKRIGAGVLGVVLTGMGSDGLRGARAIHAAGGRILTEAEATCVVFGMPSVVVQAGLSYAEARLENMALAITQHL
jgi:two-component system chemotaxis response regulator CheB